MRVDQFPWGRDCRTPIAQRTTQLDVNQSSRGQALRRLFRGVADVHRNRSQKCDRTGNHVRACEFDTPWSGMRGINGKVNRDICAIPGRGVIIRDILAARRKTVAVTKHCNTSKSYVVNCCGGSEKHAACRCGQGSRKVRKGERKSTS